MFVTGTCHQLCSFGSCLKRLHVNKVRRHAIFYYI